ncbi:hypothetical protein BC940DRAFT_344715 [Gongronella butleri]|nr:hypothetical protein BC940DRAFT_344715 [Gongronella butleri]
MSVASKEGLPSEVDNFLSSLFAANQPSPSQPRPAPIEDKTSELLGHNDMDVDGVQSAGEPQGLEKGSSKTVTTYRTSKGAQHVLRLNPKEVVPESVLTVRQLPPAWNNFDLLNTFKSYGKICQIDIQNHVGTIQFNDAQSCQRAIQAVHGRVHDHHQLLVSPGGTVRSLSEQDSPVQKNTRSPPRRGPGNRSPLHRAPYQGNNNKVNNKVNKKKKQPYQKPQQLQHQQQHHQTHQTHQAHQGPMHQARSPPRRASLGPDHVDIVLWDRVERGYGEYVKNACTRAGLNPILIFPKPYDKSIKLVSDLIHNGSPFVLSLNDHHVSSETVDLYIATTHNGPRSNFQVHNHVPIPEAMRLIQQSMQSKGAPVPQQPVSQPMQQQPQVQQQPMFATPQPASSGIDVSTLSPEYIRQLAHLFDTFYEPLKQALDAQRASPASSAPAHTSPPAPTFAQPYQLYQPSQQQQQQQQQQVPQPYYTHQPPSYTINSAPLQHTSYSSATATTPMTTTAPAPAAPLNIPFSNQQLTQILSNLH